MKLPLQEEYWLGACSSVSNMTYAICVSYDEALKFCEDRFTQTGPKKLGLFVTDTLDNFTALYNHPHYNETKDLVVACTYFYKELKAQLNYWEHNFKNNSQSIFIPFRLKV